VQHRPDRQADRLVLPPVQAEFNLRAVGCGPDVQACEGRRQYLGPNLESIALVRADDGIHRLREVKLAAGLGEQVDIGGRSIQEAVSLNRVTACQGKAIRSGRIERDASEPLVKGVHSGRV